MSTTPTLKQLQRKLDHLYLKYDEIRYLRSISPVSNDYYDFREKQIIRDIRKTETQIMQHPDFLMLY